MEKSSLPILHLLQAHQALAKLTIKPNLDLNSYYVNYRKTPKNSDTQKLL